MKQVGIIILFAVLTVFGLNQDILNLSDNTWMQMNPPREPDGRNYSHAIIGENGLVFYYGGGHFSYECDDVDLYDMSANTWTRAYEPECQSDPGMIDPVTNRPDATHTYQQVCWDPNEKVFVMNNLGTGTMQFDPATKEWDTLVPKAQAPTTPLAWQTMHTFYSPELQAPICILTTTPFGIYVYHFDTGNWTKRPSTYPDAVKWTEPYSTYVASIGKQMISASDNGMFLYDATAQTWELMTNVPSEVLGAQALSYDAASDVVVAVVKTDAGPYYAARVFIYDVQADVWHEETLSGARPIRGGGHTWGSLWYDPGHNAHFFLNRTGQNGAETWVYRYKGGSAIERPALGTAPVFSVFPNPSKLGEQLNIRSSLNIRSWTITNLLGQTVTPASAGVYILKADAGNRILTRKILIQK